MPQICFDTLESEELYFDGIEAVAQQWSNAYARFSYEKQPRANSGLFILCADLKVTVYPKNKEPFVIGRGDVLLLPIGSYYSVTFEGDFSAECIHSYVVNFSPRTKDGTLCTFGDTPLVMARDIAFERLPLSALNRAAHDIHRNHIKVYSLFFKVLEEILSMAREQDAAFYPIRHGVQLLRREWRENEKISRYAAVCGLSESYFHAIFKAWAGMTPVEYRNRLRISYACSYLKNANEKIETVARRVGFDDAFYFSRLFKKQMGMTPREYKRT